MRVFKATYKDRKGKTRQSAKWYVEFRDQNEAVRRLPGYTDRKQTENLGRNLERLAACRFNRVPLDVEMGRWVEGLPASMRAKLAKIGLLDPRTVAAAKPLADHLDDFEKALMAKGNTEKHVALTLQRVRGLFDGCGFKFWTDIEAAAVDRYLEGQRSDAETRMSHQSSNFYLAAAKQFCAWMIRERRASESPVAHLRGLNVATDRRHNRRALSVEEVRRLLTAAKQGSEQFGMTGAERALTYRLAVESGLRSNEIRSLVRTSFRFAAKLATVTVEAGNSKRRRRDELPLRPDTAAELKAHLATKHPGAPAFALPPAYEMADMLRHDLAAARKAWVGEVRDPKQQAERERSAFLAAVDEAGQVVDFHGLRHTFITNLARAGVHPSVAQSLARHSDPKLTLGRYTHVELGEQA